MDFYKVKDYIERGIDSQYNSGVWGTDPHSNALYKSMMDYSSGILRDVEQYRHDDIESFEEAYKNIEKLYSELKKGKTYQQIDDKLWYKTFEKIETALGTRLTMALKNSYGRFRPDEINSSAILNKIKKHLKKMIDMKSEKRLLVDYIHNNKYRKAISIVFEGKK